MEMEVIGNSFCGMHKVRVKVSRQYFEELKQHLSPEEPDFPEVIYMDEPKKVLDDIVDMIYEKNQLFTTLRDKYLPAQQAHYFADFLRGYFVERNAQKRKAVRETHQV